MRRETTGSYSLSLYVGYVESDCDHVRAPCPEAVKTPEAGSVIKCGVHESYEQCVVDF